MKFDRSKFMKERHEVAREKRKFHQSYFKEDKSYSDFLSDTKNDIDDRIVAYEIDFEVDYSLGGNDFKIGKQSFTIYALKGVGVDDEIKQVVTESIINSKSKSTGNGFFDGFKSSMVSGSPFIEVNVTPVIRGVEKVERDIPVGAYEGLSNNQKFYTSNLPTEITIKNKSGSTKNSLDLTYYM